MTAPLPAALRVDYGREVELTRRPNVGIHRAQVLRTERVTPTMSRVTLGGDDVAALVPVGPDQRIKILLPPDGLAWDGPPVLDDVPWALPAGTPRPRHRTYTVRRLDPGAGELDLDVVLHSGGVGAAWAAQAAPGQHLAFIGPAARWALLPTTDRLLLVGDETALPAVAAILESLPSPVDAHAVLVVAARSRPPLPPHPRATVEWFEPDPATDAARLVERVAAIDPRPGTTQVWGGGEQAAMRAVRRHLLVDRAFTRDDAYLLAFWRRGVDEQGAFVDPREHHD